MLITTWDTAAGALSYTVEAQGNTAETYNCTSSSNSCAVAGVPCGEHLTVWIVASNDICSTDRVLGEVAQTGTKHMMELLWLAGFVMLTCLTRRFVPLSSSLHPHPSVSNSRLQPRLCKNELDDEHRRYIVHCSRSGFRWQLTQL